MESKQYHLASHNHLKCASVISLGLGTSKRGVVAPEEGKLGVMGVAIPDWASDINRTLWRCNWILRENQTGP